MIKDSFVVTLPHEVDEDSDLILSEDLIVISFGQRLHQSSRVVPNEDPVKVENLCLNLLDIRFVSVMCLRLYRLVVINRLILIAIIHFIIELANGMDTLIR